MSTTKLPKVLFYVQHLLGIGHVFRATRVARALARAGCEVHVAWGGTRIQSMDLTGLIMTWLTPVKVQDEDFKTLLLKDGTPISDTQKDSRKEQLLALFEKEKPDIVITEAYPFGRRQMRFELVPLMEACKAANPRPVVVSSIRDIMQENRVEKRVKESLGLIDTYFDHVMVHGDPNLVKIDETLQGAEAIADKVFYTGLVTPEPPDALAEGFDDLPCPNVLISAGGGAVGRQLMETAIEAMPLCKSFSSGWLLTTGPDLPQDVFDKLASLADDRLTVTRFIPQLANVMSRAKISVSRAGYNTVGDMLRAGTKSVLVPFEGGLETEQYRRAKVLSDMGVATMVRDANTSPQSLAAAIDNAWEQEPKRIRLNLAGADNAAESLIELFNHR